MPTPRALRTSLDPYPSAADLRRMYRERTGKDVESERVYPSVGGLTLSTREIVMHPDPYRSKHEREYAARLDVQRRTGIIRAWQYEARRFVVGVRRTYRPDFRIVHCDRRIEYVEVKGSVRAKNARDSITRLRTAALLKPHLTFTLATRTGGEWRHQTIGEAA